MADLQTSRKLLKNKSLNNFMKKPVWTFTNKKTLNEKEFIEYFERKVFKTIRKYGLLPKDKTFKIKKDKTLNTSVLKSILEKKFLVEYSLNPNTSSENLSDIAENTFENLINANFKGISPEDKISRPLYFISDKELEVYSKLKKINGEKKKRNKKIQDLFNKFLDKNPDLEINIVKVLNQIKP